jgi:3D (Asp-Asp-Asp) domain-containing protein
MPLPPLELPLDFFDDRGVRVCTPTPLTREWWHLRALTTSYSPHDIIDDAYRKTKGERWLHITADGETDVREEPYGVAVDPLLIPYGTPIRVPGYHRGQVVEADDTGACVRRSRRQGVLHLDLRYRHTSSALRRPTQVMMVEVDVTDLTAAQRDGLKKFTHTEGLAGVQFFDTMQHLKR